MAKDAELDRLKTAQDNAFQLKQSAWEKQDKAWQRRSSARDEMNRAYEDRQRAYEAQDRSWQEVERIRSTNGPRIDALNAEQEREFQNMGAAFDRASSAYSSGDGAGAASYAADGHQHKARSQECVAERRRLVQEIRDARERHEATKPAFQQAKAAFDTAKRSFDQMKAEHERTQGEFKTAKEAFDKAAKAFKDRLEKVKAENKKRKDDKRSLAEKAGVPHQYRDNVRVSTERDGTVNIYFGGVGEPNGPGHGHYVMDSYGKVTYKRDPHDSHGKENFTDEEAYIKRQRSQGHMRGFGRAQHGYTSDGKPVTFALGWGGNEGHTLLADGHLSEEHFRQSANHNHYGPGDGPRDNVKDFGKYTGPGA